MNKIRIMLADDNEIMREALCLFLQTQDDLEVVAQAVDGHDVLAQLNASQPDVVCMDINMDRLNGIEATQQLLRLRPQTRVVGLSAHADLAKVAEMFAAGALGYVLKSSANTELLDAIRSVNRGQTYLSAEFGISDLAALAQYAQRTSP